MRPDAVSPALDAVIAEHLPGEEVVAAEMFQKAGTWSGTACGGFLSKLFGGGGDGPKGPEKFNALILTPDRLHLIGVKSKGGAWVATDPVGSWDVGDLEATANQARVDQPRASLDDPRRSVDTIQLRIEIGSETRALELEGTLWGDESKAQQVTDAVLAACG